MAGLLSKLFSRFREPSSMQQMIDRTMASQAAYERDMDRLQSFVERRSLENPTFAVNPAQLDMIWGYGPTRSGVQINEHTAMTIVAVYAAHKILGETMGMMPCAVYQGDEDEKQRVRAKEHPAYELLRRAPNDEMSAFTFRETMMHHCAGWGNAYARIKFDNGGRPFSLHPLKPDRTYPERKAGKLVYRIDRGEGFYGSEEFWPEEVLHVPGLSFDGLKGYSPISLAREALGGGKAAEIYGSTFYGNGGTVQGFLKYPGKLRPEAKANLRESFHSMHGGSANAWKTGILEEGMDYVKVGIPPGDSQFIEARRFSVVDIARLYRLPPHMLADHERATHSNIEQASLEFLVYTMTPWITKFEQEYDRKLCDGNYYTRFDERALLRSDLEQRVKYYTAMRQWGVYSANDVCRDEGIQPIGEQGDVYLSPVNMENAKLVMNQIEPKAKPPANGEPGENPFGGNPAVANNRAIAAAAMRAPFEDAIARMLRKEANASGKGKASDSFYQDHRQHVREAMAPHLRALGVMLGKPVDEAAVLHFAEERHDGINGNIPALAAQKAGEMIDNLIAGESQKVRVA